MKTGNPFLDSHIHVVGIPKPDEKKMASKKKSTKKFKVASKPVRRTASKPSKGTKRIHSTPRGKKTVSAKKEKVKTIKDYRRLHQAIPGNVYAAEVNGAGETQTIKKKNYAPLGRPPGSYPNRGIYMDRKKQLTPHGQYVRSKRQKARDRKNGFDRSYMEYLNAQDEYYYDMARDDTLDDRIVMSELEDRGYSDYKRNWKQLGKAKKNLAYREMVKDEYSRRNYEYDY